MIQLKSQREIEVMARGGRILAEAVALMEKSVKPGISTQDLDKIAEDFIRSHDGAVPSFKGLYNFPASICTSINNEIVHGIPSRKRVLVEGDIVSVDIGVKFEGYHTDSATTVAVGEIGEESRRLLATTRDALEAGVNAARSGNHLGDIGAAVQGVVEKAGFSVVRDLVGHGIGSGFHEEPQVPNYGKPKRGLRIVPGLTIAIEPMVNIGKPGIRTMPDRWTVVTIDGTRSAHFEHTVAITENGPRILTAA
ncbi:MAG: type I methionyl aminopeptidase [Gemmatimonadota bacterium]|nr:type I methionyl aminopeptidase [Gemmatimonadota bacterium]